MNAWLADNTWLWQLAGWTMIHFLWIGAVAAIIGGAVRLACRGASPNVRYATSLLTLAVLAALPVGIAAWLALHSPAILAGSPAHDSPPALRSRVAANPDANELAATRRSSEAERAAPPPIVIDLAHADPPQGTGISTPSFVIPHADFVIPTPPTPSFVIPHSDFVILNALVPYLPAAWLVGAPLTFLLLAAGLVGSQRLRRDGKLLDAGPAFDACQHLRAALGVTRQVSLAVCDRVAQPVLVGIVRPLILLPAAAVAGWTPAELEMVLLHELAHVRRWDNLVNLLQRLVESLLFFHPAVWLASRQVRLDREECCDAIVVARTERPGEYAELLVSIAAALRGRGRPGSLVAASAMADHPLAGRIRRILKLEDEPMRVSSKTIVAALVAPLLIATATLYAVAAGDDENPPPSKGREQPSTVASGDRAQGGSPREATRGGIEIAEESPSQEEQPSTAASDDREQGGSFDDAAKDQPPAATPTTEEITELITQIAEEIDLVGDLQAIKAIAIHGGHDEEVLERWIRASVDVAPDVVALESRFRDLQRQISTSAKPETASSPDMVKLVQERAATLQQIRSAQDAAKIATHNAYAGKVDAVLDKAIELHAAHSTSLKTKMDELAAMKRRLALAAGDAAPPANKPMTIADLNYMTRVYRNFNQIENLEPEYRKEFLRGTHRLLPRYGGTARINAPEAVHQRIAARLGEGEPESADNVPNFKEAASEKNKSAAYSTSDDQAQGGSPREATITCNFPPNFKQTNDELARIVELVKQQGYNAKAVRSRYGNGDSYTLEIEIPKGKKGVKVVWEQHQERFMCRVIDSSNDAADTNSPLPGVLDPVFQPTNAPALESHQPERSDVLREFPANADLKVVEAALQQALAEGRDAIIQQNVDGRRRIVAAPFHPDPIPDNTPYSQDTDDIQPAKKLSAKDEIAALKALIESDERQLAYANGAKQIILAGEEEQEQNALEHMVKVEALVDPAVLNLSQRLRDNQLAIEAAAEEDVLPAARLKELVAERAALRYEFRSVRSDASKAARKRLSNNPGLVLEKAIERAAEYSKAIQQNRRKLSEMEARLARLQHGIDDKVMAEIESGVAVGDSPAGGEDAPARLAGSDAELEIAKIRAELDMLTKLRTAAQMEKAALQALREEAVRQAQHSMLGERSVQQEIERDPIIASFKQQMFSVQQAMRQGEATSGDGSRFKQLESQRRQLEDQMAQYRMNAMVRAAARRMPGGALRTELIECVKRWEAADANEKKYASQIDELNKKLTALAARESDANDLPPVSVMQWPVSVDGRTTAYLKVKLPTAKLTPEEIEKHSTSNLALVLSPTVIKRALQTPELRTLFRVNDPPKWVADRVKVSFPGEGEIMELRIEGKQEAAESDRKLLTALINAYLAEVNATAAPPAGGEAFDKLSRADAPARSDQQREEENASIRKAFEPRDDNPTQTEMYVIPPSVRGHLREAFEAFEKDPYGPKVKVNWKWIDDKTKIAVTAPQAAHELMKRTPLIGSKAAQARAAASESDFLYDGKTFDDWRTQWKHELKVERRIEAIDALAAFARAGYAEQAAEAILDVAGEYDFTGFSIADQSPEGALKKAVVERLGISPAGQFPMKVWLPLLMDRLTADQVKWRPFAKAILSQMHFGSSYKDPESRELLLRMATEPQYGPNALALRVLYRMPDTDPQVEQLIKAALQGDDAANALDMLAELRFNDLRYLTEQVDLLFHQDSEVRGAARVALTRARFGELEAVAKRLLKILDDPEQSAKHADAVRALGVLQNYQSGKGEVNNENPRYSKAFSQKVWNSLMRLLKDGPVELLPPILVALGGDSPEYARSMTTGDHISPERQAEIETAFAKYPEELKQATTGGE